MSILQCLQDKQDESLDSVPLLLQSQKGNAFLFSEES